MIYRVQIGGHIFTQIGVDILFARNLIKSSVLTIPNKAWLSSSPMELRISDFRACHPHPASYGRAECLQAADITAEFLE